MKNIDLNNKALGSLCDKEIPKYDLDSNKCQILHIGVGNFHRSHQAYYLHKLLQLDDSGWRICGAGLMSQDLKMKEALKKQDYLFSLVSQELEKEDLSIIGTIRNFIHIPSEFDSFLDKVCDDDLKIISLTITEKGYSNTTNWDLDVENKNIIHDLNEKNETPKTAIGVLSRALKERMLREKGPITILSCDNIAENGHVLKRLLLQYIKLENDLDLLKYVQDNVKFPCCMVDRITPTTTAEKKEYLLNKYSINDLVPVFSEQYLQWVIEDDFNVERPKWENVGAQIVDDVKPYEIMKTRLLNGAHTALTFPSLLKNFVFVDDAMNDDKIKSFVNGYMQEVKGTLNPIEDVDYDEYINSLIIRFSNPATKDMLLRLAEDTSSKFLNFIINPLVLLLKANKEVSIITIIIASWIVYLSNAAFDEKLEVKDPLSNKLKEVAPKALIDASLFLSIDEIFPKEILKYSDFIDDLNEKIAQIKDNGIEKVLDNIRK